MKKMRQHIALLFLSLLISTQVGVHLFHHHEAEDHGALHGLTHIEEADSCSLCSLSLFIVYDVPSVQAEFITVFQEGNFVPVRSNLVSSSLFFSQGRAPPALNLL